MVAVTSTMQTLGSAAPKFSLPDVTADNQLGSASNCVAQPMLVMFICNHCPYVVHIMSELTTLANQAKRDGFAVFAISSNDALNYPQDGPEAMAGFARQYGFQFPYLYDETQQVAKDFGAACTPDFFVYDAEHCLRYRGQMDESRPGNNSPVSGDDLSAALSSVLSGQAVVEKQTPSVGCNIKWSAGNAPDYF